MSTHKRIYLKILWEQMFPEIDWSEEKKGGIKYVWLVYYSMYGMNGIEFNKIQFKQRCHEAAF